MRRRSTELAEGPWDSTKFRSGPALMELLPAQMFLETEFLDRATHFIVILFAQSQLFLPSTQAISRVCFA